MSHNFMLDRVGKAFNRSAPIIKLPSDATEVDHLAVLGLLNSTTACFWMKQGFRTIGEGCHSYQGELIVRVRAYVDSAMVARFPIA